MRFLLVLLTLISLSTFSFGAIVYTQTADLSNATALGANSLAGFTSWASTVNQLATFNLDAAVVGTTTGALQTVNAITLSGSACTNCGAAASGIRPYSGTNDWGYPTSGTQMYQVLALGLGTTGSPF